MRSLLNIEVVLPAQGARRWHADLIAGLRREGHRLRINTAAPGPRIEGVGLTLLQALEQIIYKGPAIHPATFMSRAEVTRLSTSEFAGEADVVVDLTGSDLRPGPSFAPLYDGSRDEAAAIAAILDERTPILSIIQNGRIIASGLPALEHRDIVTRALDCVFARTASLLRHAIAVRACGFAAEEPTFGGSAVAEMHSPLLFGAKTFTTKLARALTRLAGQHERWRIAWRFANGDAVGSTLRWPRGRYTVLADDGARYFADPFVFENAGVHYVFCEEFPFATGKGVISVFTIGPGGVTSTPRVVIEAPYHLSYPMVFTQHGTIYMIPESSAAGTIEIWRAARFPDLWAKETVLLDSHCACDATLIKHDGRFWLFATLAGDGGTSMEALELFHAPDLFGAWEPHPLNPVLVDARAARPAGFMLEPNGKLRRIAQDCTRIYGGGLTICAVERLDPDGYAQRIEARLPPPPGSGALGVHTLNAAGGLEVVDLFC